jgi:holo-[acyl-carrier protein] synthase
MQSIRPSPSKLDKLGNPPSLDALMGVLGFGVDVVHVPRILSLINRRGLEKFATKILSEREVEAWKATRLERDSFREAQYLAVR